MVKKFFRERLIENTISKKKKKLLLSNVEKQVKFN